RDRDEAEQVPRLRPDVIGERGSPVRARRQLDPDLHLGDGAAQVAADDAEAERPDPLERLLVPLDPDAEPREPQPVCAGRRVDTGRVERGNAGVAVEAVRVGDEWPDRLRARFELPD